MSRTSVFALAVCLFAAGLSTFAVAQDDIAPAEAEMKRLEKSFEYEKLEGAGHGFLRQQDGRDGANLKATEKAWPRTIGFLKKHSN